jgi:DHA3 family macrolide efflux protein-like MFS transporter
MRAPIEAWKKNFGVFLGSQALSLFGSSLVQYTIMWHITLSTRLASMMTISILVGFIPSFVLSPFAGVWADRLDRKKLIALADAGIAAATLLVALAYIAGYRELWLLYACLGVRLSQLQNSVSFEIGFAVSRISC